MILNLKKTKQLRCHSFRKYQIQINIVEPVKNKTEEIGTEYLYIDGLILVFKGIENMETFPRKIAHLIDRIDALVCFKYFKKDESYWS